MVRRYSNYSNFDDKVVQLLKRDINVPTVMGDGTVSEDNTNLN